MTCSVYVIGPCDGLYKIGISEKPKQRLSEIQRHTGPLPAIAASYEQESFREAREVELLAHRGLKHRQIRGEWFNITPEEAAGAIEAAIAELRERDRSKETTTFGVKKMPARTAKIIRREAQKEGLTIAQWLERRVPEWTAPGYKARRR